MDLLIQNALVFDGIGNAPQVQDVAVHQGYIQDMGLGLKHHAKHTIDAQGLALMPGIIDSHTITTPKSLGIRMSIHLQPLALPPRLLEIVVSLLHPANQPIAK